eukprot:scaffold31011_cov47-Cyclotella_meneghiniana.AAC.4
MKDVQRAPPPYFVANKTAMSSSINQRDGSTPSINQRRRPSAALWLSLFVSVATMMPSSVRGMACRHYSKALGASSTVHINFIHRHDHHRRRPETSSLRFSSYSGVAFASINVSRMRSNCNIRTPSPSSRIMQRFFSSTTTALPSHNHDISTDADTSNEHLHWKHSNLTETIYLPSISVPSHHVHSLLRECVKKSTVDGHG